MPPTNFPLTPLAFNQMMTDAARALAWRRRQLQRQAQYEARGAALELQTCTASEVVISGPARTGKSRAVLEKLYRLALTHAGFRGAIIRKTKTSLSETGLVTFERDVLGASHPLVFNGAQRRNRQTYPLDNGSIIVVAGMDKPSRILSGEYDFIFVQQAEELKLDEWETLLTRLSGVALPQEEQQLVGDCNPSSPRHWLKQRAEAGTVVMLESRHKDNPLLHDGHDWTSYGRAYLEKLDRLTGARKQRLRYGRWVQAEGVVYPEYDADVHLIDRFDLPRHWPRYRVIDFGFTNPFVCLWCAADPDGRLYMYREIYMTQRTVRSHAQQINALSLAPQYTTLADTDAEDIATLRENGIHAEPAQKAVSLGIERVKERLKIQADGKPRLFFMRDSLVEMDASLEDAGKPYSVTQEFDSYIWNDRQAKDVPVKEYDHGLDALRYLVMHLDDSYAVDPSTFLELGEIEDYRSAFA